MMCKADKLNRINSSSDVHILNICELQIIFAKEKKLKLETDLLTDN